MTMRIKVAAILGLALLAQAAVAEGQYEINQLCVSTGCLASDAPGWPVELTEPGSYRLTSNLTVSGINTVDAVLIASSNVSMNLNGYSNRGDVTCFGNDPICFAGFAQFGVVTSSNEMNNIQISNGWVTGFDQDCIDLQGQHSIVRDVQIAHCGENGLDVPNGFVERVMVHTVGANGGRFGRTTSVQNSRFINSRLAGVVGGVCQSNVFDSNRDTLDSTEEFCERLVENNTCGGSASPVNPC
ncbi:MAG: hypothetical protein AAGH65_06545 [Pseudomonadota bacterium]